jgi:hypothetical protein
MKHSTMLISEVVRTVELAPIDLGEGDAVQFRIEIHQLIGATGKYFAQVWRIEHYRIQPTFPQAQNKLLHGPADERIIVRDDQFPVAEATTVEMTLEKALEMISKRFLMPGGDQIR